MKVNWGNMIFFSGLCCNFTWYLLLRSAHISACTSCGSSCKIPGELAVETTPELLQKIFNFTGFGNQLEPDTDYSFPLNVRQDTTRLRRVLHIDRPFRAVQGKRTSSYLKFVSLVSDWL